MPTENMVLAVSTGVSFGLLAGIVSGVCFLLSNGYVWPTGGRECRDRQLRGGGGGAPEEGEGEEPCVECGRGLDPAENACLCNDLQRPVKFEKGHWFLQQVQKTLSFMPWSISSDKLDQTEVERARRGSSASGEAKSIREFMEQLSERLAGGALDRTSVAAIYDHPSYAGMFSRHHAQLRDALAALGGALRTALTNLPQVRDGVRVEPEAAGASGAHARVKRLVQRVIAEAMALPALAHYARDKEPRTPAFDAHTYEDLLATAILNKVIERYQSESTGGRSADASSGIHSASGSPTPSSSNSPSAPSSPHTPPLHDDDNNSESEWEGEGAPAPPRRAPLPEFPEFPEFGGDIVHATDHFGEERAESFDEVPSSDLQAADGSWEENWLFQKKKIKTLQSVPVPMLVPNSNAEYRALIGDRDADDTTDLSEAGSDTDEETEYKSDIQRAIQSKTVIGGKTPIDQLIDIETNNDLELINDNLDAQFKDSLTDTHVANEIIDNQISAKEIDSTTEIQEVSADFNSSNSESVIIIGVDSGPLSKAEFSVGEIHRTPNGNVSTDDVDGVVVSTINTAAFKKEIINSLSNSHQQDGEYEETIALPVQRYADSLRRQHYTDISTKDMTPIKNDVNGNDTKINEDELIPGSIADRERKKWLNYVEMPNNPYSAEAIQKRLSNKSTSTLFDFLTTKSNSDDQIKVNSLTKQVNGVDTDVAASEVKPASPSPKILKDVLAEEVPQYKRYGRDYYINEAKRSAGARKKTYLGDTSSISSMNKSTSLEQFDTNEFTSPGLLINKFNLMAVTRHGDTISSNKIATNSITTNNKTNNEKNMIEIDYDDISEQSLFSAKPAYADDETDKKFEEILRATSNATCIELKNEETLRETALNFDKLQNESSDRNDEAFLSSSSLEDSMKIYNVPMGEIVKRPRDSEHSIRIESLTDIDRNKNIPISDKNCVSELDSKPLSENNDSQSKITSSVNKMVASETEIYKVIEDLNINLPRVKDLAKKFVIVEGEEEKLSKPRRRKFSNDYELEIVNKNDHISSGKQLSYMHSLTARSISKEFREELKLSMATPIKIPGGANEIPEGIEDVTRETSRPTSPVPEPGTLKNKLAFFESLKS